MHTEPESNWFYAIGLIRKWIIHSKQPMYKHILKHSVPIKRIVSVRHVNIDIKVLRHGERDFTVTLDYTMKDLDIKYL